MKQYELYIKLTPEEFLEVLDTKYLEDKEPSKLYEKIIERVPDSVKIWQDNNINTRTQCQIVLQITDKIGTLYGIPVIIETKLQSRKGHHK